MMVKNRPTSKRPTSQSLKATTPRRHLHVKRGDTVVVLSGRDKGKTGVVKQVFPDKGKLIVENVNMVVKATRPNPMIGVTGGLVRVEAPLDASKVMYYDSASNVASRLGTRVIVSNAASAAGGQPERPRRVRYVKKTNQLLDTLAD